MTRGGWPIEGWSAPEICCDEESRLMIGCVYGCGDGEVSQRV